MAKIIQMPKRDQPDPVGDAAQVHSGSLHPLLPDAEEEHASVARINTWVSLADVALGATPATRKKA